MNKYEIIFSFKSRNENSTASFFDLADKVQPMVNQALTEIKNLGNKTDKNRLQYSINLLTFRK